MVMAKGRKGIEQTINKTMTLIELKNYILQTLHKLSDRDTQQSAMEELERIAQNLTHKGITLFLACLHDTDAQYKRVVRRDCIRLVGTLTAIHGDLLACHLPKMVGNIIRRLKDPDSNIREACVETIGILASQIGSVDLESTTNVFVKPLLEALVEQHENLQTGASMCLAEVIKCSKDPHILTLQRLCPQLLKMLARPNFLAKASLLNAIGVMVQVPGVVSLSQLSVLLNLAQEELINSEWAVRKAIADTLSSIASTASPALGPYRESILIALENTRLDKVKLVRDSVCEAMQLWKSIYYTNGLHGAQPSKSQKSRSPTKFFDGDATLPLNDLKNSLLMRFGISRDSSICNKSESLKPMLNKHANTQLKKKKKIHSDKKANPEFFQKVEDVKDFINWQVGIAGPHDSPHGGSPRACRIASENPVYHNNCTATLPKSNSLYNDPCETLCPESHRCADPQYDQNEVGQINQPQDNGDTTNFVKEIEDNGYQDPKPNEPLDCNEKWEETQTHQNDEYVPQWDTNVTSMNDVDKPTIDMVSIHQHFNSLERQQLSIMEMLQESMVHMHESFRRFEERVSRLEHIAGDPAQDSSNADGRSTIDESPSHQCCHAHDPNYFSNDFFEERASTEEIAIPSSPRTQTSRSLASTCGDSDEFTFIRTGHVESETVKQLPSTVLCGSSCLHRLTGEEDLDAALPQEIQAAEATTTTTTRVCDHHGHGHEQVGRGSSTTAGRSVWHASRDEAIAAIRGAAAIPASSTNIHGNHHRKAPPQHYSGNSSRDYFNIDQKQASVLGGPFWMLWSRAMENVRSRNLDVAYSDILGSKDELLLVRLMAYTGPVWEQLGTATVSQLMISIKQFLQNQRFLDCIVPWLQQVSDLVSSKGPKALGLTGETKDLVLALQNATSMEYAQSSMGATITELAEQLRNAWSSGKSS